ncbi:MAG: transglycosylase SLT domain-containing protein [Proteobacteria bacterium]|nr:transglycosylase SLT domain-containing protein [Pseudomonadota bacterium]
MKHWLWLLSFMPLLALSSPGDDKVLAAREAFRNGERIKLGRQADAMSSVAAQGSQHDLQPWVEYWRLQQRLDDGDSEGVRDFLATQKGSYLAEKLRSEWLKLLGKQRKWDEFLGEYAALAQPDQELACYELQGRLNSGQGPAALDEVRPLWTTVLDLPDSCFPLMEQLIVAGRIDANDVWERLRRLLEAKKLKAAKQTAAYLPAAQSPSAKTLDAIADKPLRALDKPTKNFAATRVGREMALYAVQRLAHADPIDAAKHWQKIENQFSEAERGYAWGQLAWQAAQQHLPEALIWYGLAANIPLSEEQLAWQARAALRAHDWPMVMRAIDRMPAKMSAQPDWSYWLARALMVHNRPDEARALYQKIAGQPNFYSNLADEELNRLIIVPPRAAPPTPEELAAARDNPGLRRALALFRLDLRLEGLREWNWTLRGMNDRQLLAAADLALRSEVFDRAISAADRTQVQHDYALRYLAPFRDSVEPLAKEMAVDSGWVYGLMRQESRFMMNAHSGVGAKGLMQLMPKTAQWVAKKIGLKDYHPTRVADLGTNLTLGTNYLRMVLASLDNHPVLASAAYNAGPGRARRWRAEVPLEGAIYAETIPFNETRDYVKRVMSNAVYYSALFEDKPQSLKIRLGTVGPRGSGAAKTAALEDLP